MKPKRYRAYHIVPGIVEYSENGQRETVLVKKEILDKMNPSFIGKPVFNFSHKVIDAEEAFNFTAEEKERQAVGVVSDVGYDVETGYFTADLMIWDDDTIKNIDDKGFNVSCAYIPDTGPGGVYNNVQFDEEVTGGEYHHMAIVENPRYNEAKIFQNSKHGGVMKFKLNFGKKSPKIKKNELPPEEDKKLEEEEEIEMNADAVIETPDGEKIPISELIENYRSKQNMDEEGEQTLSMDDTVEVDGKEVSVKELYENYKSKQNSEPATDDPLEPEITPALKKNSVDKPNENFKLVQNAANAGAEPDKVKKPETLNTRIERGRARYGAVVSNGGAK